ncbi:MAG: SDR family oxidoreductase [Proteobacteria bacterium]|nr:SDR family oxidoreductase [Pseudomonadota bacterium]MBI3499655.1 SDR family oxidoreductase [Pseudomonadota bacterium]
MPFDPSSLFDVRDKVAVVTGAGGGIGAALTHGFAALGAKVLAVDIAEPSQLPENAFYHRADLRDRTAIPAIAGAAQERFGRIDILVNNAGVVGRARAEEMLAADWDNTLSINLTGTFQLSQAVGRIMIAQRSGKIVNVSSRCGFVGIPFISAYNVSKAGIVALTQTLAIEWSLYNVQVNTVVPGFVRTKMNERWLADPVSEALYARKIPLGRISEPEDLLGAVIFLSSAASDYVTGATLFVDGGNYASGGVGAEARDHGLKQMQGN